MPPMPAPKPEDGATPPVAVIITCFNQASFLAEAIESALAQTHPPVEVLVTDDGSTDGTAEVAGRYPVRYRWQPNAGLGAARNAGIAETDAPFLVFLDADDRLLPEALAAGIACHHQRDGCALVYGGYAYINAAGRRNAPPVRRGPVADPYAALLRKNHIGMHATVIYRRSTFAELGGFDTTLRACEDHEMYLKAARWRPIGWHDTLVAEYRRHGGNMSNDHTRMLAAGLAVLRRHEAHVSPRRDHRWAVRAGARFMIAKAGRAVLGYGVAAAARGRLGEACGAFLGALRLVPPWLVASTKMNAGPSQTLPGSKAKPA